MQRRSRWKLVALVVGGMLLAACAAPAATQAVVDPARVEPIEGTDLQRVLLTEKAAERLDIQTATVREEQVTQMRTLVGEVVALPSTQAAGLGDVAVRVSLSANDLSLVDPSQPARVLPFDQGDEEDTDDEENGWTAELDEAPGLDDADEDAGQAQALYYRVAGARARMLPGQRVFVEVALAGSETLRKIVPYAALLYDVTGGTWVYTQEPNALAFVRQSVTVDYIEDDLAYLTEGPPIGTAVVTVGAAELYGAETGVSK